jgi:hypothetical protein
LGIGLLKISEIPLARPRLVRRFCGIPGTGNPNKVNKVWGEGMKVRDCV